MQAKARTDNFKIKMIEAKVTQTQLAEEFNVKRQTANGWVTGRIVPSINTGLKIAERLGCSMEDLWEYKEDVDEGNTD